MEVFSIALSISTARRRNTPPWRSSPRLILGTRSFHTAGSRSVSEGARTMMATAVRTTISVILPVMLFHMIRWCSFPYPQSLSGRLLRLGDGRILARAGDGAAAHLHADLVGDLQGDGGIGHSLHLAVKASGGDHPVAHLEVLDEIALLARLFLLRTDQQEVEDHEHEEDREKPHEAAAPSDPPTRGPPQA